MIDYRELVKAGVHFGHQRSRWSPKMAPYIWGHKNGVHLVDVSKTAVQLEKAAQFLKSVVAQGKTIVWVGTKKSAQKAILDCATQVNMPYITHRFIGGTLTNFPQIKKAVTKLLHYKDVLERSAENHHYTKKELNMLQKEVERLEKNVGGITSLAWPVGALVVVDVRKEFSAVREASRMGVPVVALVDTNNDPSFVDYVIPGNDDAPRAVKTIMDYLAAAVTQGVELAQQANIEKVVANVDAAETTAEMRLNLEEDEAKARRRAGAASRGGAARNNAPRRGNDKSRSSR